MFPVLQRSEEIRAIAQVHGLAGYFLEIMGSRQGFNKGREHVEYILRKQAASKDEVVFVGDEPFDVAIGREAGVLTIVRVGTYPENQLIQSGPDHVIASLGELPGILEQIDGREED